MNTNTILLVDDDVDFMASNRIALESAGFRVLTAYNGKEGMEIACNNRIDTAVLDVMMDTPEEGLVLAREMKRNASTRNIPLILLTSLNAVNQKAGYKVRFSDMDRDDVWLPIERFIDKPVNANTLVAEIRKLILKKKAGQPLDSQ